MTRSCCFRVVNTFAMVVLIVTSGVRAIAESPAVLTEQGTSAHPLVWAIEHAKSHSNYIREKVRDYSCSIVKRERIDGELQYIRAKVRCGQQNKTQAAQPMSVFLQYLAPSAVKDRRVIYIEGKNDGMMLVRKGSLGPNRGPGLHWQRL